MEDDYASKIKQLEECLEISKAEKAKLEKELENVREDAQNEIAKLKNELKTALIRYD